MQPDQNPTPDAREETFESLDYVRKYYGVPAEVGQRVTHEGVGGKQGTVKGGTGAHVAVLFDGESFAVPCHPLSLDYGDGVSPQQRTDERNAQIEAFNRALNRRRPAPSPPLPDGGERALIGELRVALTTVLSGAREVSIGRAARALGHIDEPVYRRYHDLIRRAVAYPAPSPDGGEREALPFRSAALSEPFLAAVAEVIERLEGRRPERHIAHEAIIAGINAVEREDWIARHVDPPAASSPPAGGEGQDAPAREEWRAMMSFPTAEHVGEWVRDRGSAEHEIQTALRSLDPDEDASPAEVWLERRTVSAPVRVDVPTSEGGDAR